MKYTADEFVKYMPSILGAAVTDASTDGTGVDCKGYDECLVIFDAILAAANAEGDVHIEESDDNSTFADITGAVFTQITPSNDAASMVGRIDLRTHKRYLRAVLATDGSNAFTGSVGFALINPKYGPASQTAIFDV